MKKLIIIEGTDNTGKDTLINGLDEKLNIDIIYHCSKPKSDKPELAAIEQNKLFDSYARLFNGETMQEMKSPEENDVVLMNRAWQGEYVYGVLYRGRKDNDVISMIENIDSRILDIFKGRENDYAYITLLSKNPELQNRNEDGESLSGGKVDRIIEETKRFEDIFSKSIVPNKHIIYVTDDNGEFRSKEDILNEAISFIFN